jgi:hypothetical protein
MTEMTTEVGNAQLLQVHWIPYRWERDHHTVLVPVEWCQLFPLGRLVWRSIETIDLAPLLHTSNPLSPVKHNILMWIFIRLVLWTLSRWWHEHFGLDKVKGFNEKRASNKQRQFSLAELTKRRQGKGCMYSPSSHVSLYHQSRGNSFRNLLPAFIS